MSGGGRKRRVISYLQSRSFFYIIYIQGPAQAITPLITRVTPLLAQLALLPTFGRRKDRSASSYSNSLGQRWIAFHQNIHCLCCTTCYYKTEHSYQELLGLPRSNLTMKVEQSGLRGSYNLIVTQLSIKTDNRKPASYSLFFCFKM